MTAWLVGASNLPFATFAALASCGAILWSATSIALSTVLREEWHRQSSLVPRIGAILAAGLVLAITVRLLIKRRRLHSDPSIT